MVETKMAQDSNAQTQTQSLTGILDTLVDKTDGQKVSIEELLSVFDNRSYGPLLLVPSLLALGPTGAIPGMSIFMGSLIILIAAQMLFKHGQPWLPRQLREFEFSRDKLTKAVEASKPYVAKVEKWIKPRLTALSTKPGSYFIPAVCIVFALMMFPLALLPFAVALPALGLTLISIGLTLKDGYFIVAGYILGGLSIFTLTQFI